MPQIIDILLEEHQNIEKLLLVLEHELEYSIAAVTGLRDPADDHPIFSGLPRKLPSPEGRDDLRETEDPGPCCSKTLR